MTFVCFLIHIIPEDGGVDVVEDELVVEWGWCKM